MPDNITVVAAAHPFDCAAAEKTALPVMHLAYKASENRLYKAQGAAPRAGDMMGVEVGGEYSPDVTRQISDECSSHRLIGITLSGEQDACRRTAQQLIHDGAAVFLPESLSDAPSGSYILISSAVSGGTYRQRIAEAQGRHKGRTALETELVRADFTLPSRNGAGTEMSWKQLKALIQRYSPKLFFSSELCARYFHYTSGGKTHFVLFDDAGTIQKKLSLAAQLGVKYAFLYYAHVCDILPELLNPHA